MAADSKVVCILGMHRSGTSLLTGWLNSCGLNVGDNLLPKDFSNKAGHFEDLDFLSLHKDILRSHGLDASGLRVKKIDFDLSGYHKSRLDHLLQMKHELHSQWGWKDPRTCLFIDHYLSRISDLKILVIHRSANEVIQSLLRRDWERWRRLMQKESLWGLHPKLAMQSYFKRKLVMEKLPQYIHACEVYFEKLITVIHQSLPKDKLVFTLPYFLKHDLEIYNSLKSDWDLKLEYAPSKNIYEPQLLGDSFKIQISLSGKLTALDSELAELVKK